MTEFYALAFFMHIALVTSVKHPHGHPEDQTLIAALRTHGMRSEPAIWSDPAQRWSGYDAVVLRTPWDYFERYPEFLRWLDALDAAACRVFNPTATVRWNADKRYLVQLAAAGLPVIPTRVLPRDSSTTLAALVQDTGWRELVLKPTVSAGAWRTIRVAAADAGRRQQELGSLLAQGDVLAQPYVPEVASDGEWSLLFFGGRYSHAVHKRPRAGDFRVQERFGGSSLAAEAAPALIAAAQDVVDALPGLGHGGCAYARVDGVRTPRGFALMEVELIEPQLFLEQQPQGGARYAEALAQMLR